MSREEEQIDTPLRDLPAGQAILPTGAQNATSLTSGTTFAFFRRPIRCGRLGRCSRADRGGLVEETQTEWKRIRSMTLFGFSYHPTQLTPTTG